MAPCTRMSSIIGYWMAEKKVQKLNMQEFKKDCKKRGFDLVKLDLTRSLEEQGPFCVIFHKCTDIILKANAGDPKSQAMVKTLERYLLTHPEVPIIDPLDRVRRMLDRYQCYLAISSSPRLTAAGVFTPTFVELTSNDPNVNITALRTAGVRFPLVCKPSVSHGSNAHEMAIIFNETGVADCKPPAVAQTFINHNAVLHKVFCVGDQYVLLERPSLKNFYHSEGEKTIFFSSADVSKSDSTSSLNALDDDDPLRGSPIVPVDSERLKIIVETIREEMGLKLWGVDIVAENNTGRYAIIDLNAYPGYDGYPNLFDSMLECLEKTMKEHVPRSDRTSSPDAVSPSSDQFPRIDQEDSGIDTSDSSDEKKRQLNDSSKVR